MEFRWTKHEIVDAVIAEYRPFDFDDDTSWPHLITVRVLARLALGTGPRGAPRRIRRTLCASDVGASKRRFKDPNAAYDVPLDDETPLTAEDQLTLGYRAMAELLNQIENDLQARRPR
jgi:hypothetical protein